MNKRQASAIAVTVVVAAAAGGGLVIASVGKNGSATSSAATASDMTARGGQSGAGGPPGGMAGPGRGPGGGLDAAATYLGVDTATLFSDLRSGKTLADVAQATSGKTVAGLIDAMVAARTTQLDTAVAGGRLAASQEATLLAGLKTHVAASVNGTGGPGPGGPPGSGPARPSTGLRTFE